MNVSSSILDSSNIGQELHQLMSRLFPLCRSLTGDGLRQSLSVLQEFVPIRICAVPSGTSCFDWVVPDEWNIRDAFIEDSNDNKVIDFKNSNLHVVNYSIPVDCKMTLAELKEHLHFLEDKPEAIPYVTSYYKRSWGFCLTHKQYESLEDGNYRVRIDSSLTPGEMNYGELIIPGKESTEVLLATNICHPSMANNELSGPVILAALAKWLLDNGNNRLTYRLVWLPETIGAISYLAQHSDAQKKNTMAGYQVVCVGGPDDFTYLKSRKGDTVADQMALHILDHSEAPYRVLDYTHRASDERQWCSPGIDLPVGSLMRSKYHDYPEYHTSLDDLSFVKPVHLEASYNMYAEILTGLEQNVIYKSALAGCEPQLGKRGLYPTTGGSNHECADVNDLLAILAYADGGHTLIDIAKKHDRPIWEFYKAAKVLVDGGLIEHQRPTSEY